jgi:hypothetical protein
MAQTKKTPDFADFNAAANKLGVLKGVSLTYEAAEAETTVAHGLGRIPKVIIPTCTGKAYAWQSKQADETNVYLKATAAEGGIVYVG